MKYDEANIILDKNRHLEGTKYKGKYITELIIIPTDEGSLGKVIDAHNRGISVEWINYQYDDFTVIALLDFDEYRIGGILQIKNLEDILRKR